MTSFSTKVALAPVAASFALALAMAVSAPASAQSQLTNGAEGEQPNTLAQKPHGVKMRRPLTVRRAAAAPVEAAAAVPAAVGNPVSGALGVGSAVVGLPFQVLGGIFPSDTGVRKGGVTAVRYAGTGEKQAEIDEGWNQPVPVDHSGPIFVVENGDPTVSPFTFVGRPIAAVGTLVQTPFRILGGGPVL